MRSLSRAAAALIAVALASPCWAGQVKLEIRDGLVTLSAKDASLREILTEWSRVGQTRVVNAERAPGGLLNLELNGVPEAKALDIVLRSVAGYVAAPRRVNAPAGSRFDRIIVMAQPRPASGGAAPAPVATAPTPPPYDPRTRMGGYQPPPSLMVDDQDEPVQQAQPQPQPQPQQQPGAPTSTTGAQSAPQPGMPTAPAPATPVAPGQVPQATPLPPGQQPNSPAAGRPGVMTPAQKPPGAPGGPGGN